MNLISKLKKEYDIEGGYKRIYHYHIRKTAGTSFNNAMLSLGGEDGNEVRMRLVQSKSLKTISKDKVYVRKRKHIERGSFFYGYSHSPCHQIKIPSDTFTITILRDPVKRVLSHYKMLKGFEMNNIQHPCMEIEGEWLGNSVEDFLSNIPQEHLLRQIYMFSSSYNIEEAYSNIINCSYFCFTEEFKEGICDLSQYLKIDIPILHVRKTNLEININQEGIDRLKKILEPEYKLIGKLEDYKLNVNNNDTFICE